LSKYLFLLLSCLYAHTGFGQLLNEFNGKWLFTGLRTTVFEVRENRLYLGMIEYGDTANFNRFVQGSAIDTAAFSEATVSQVSDTIVINAKFPAIVHELNLLFSPKDSNYILLTGDVYFDSTRVINTNANCNLKRPACINRLYNRNDLRSITDLKTKENFTRDDAFEFLLRINEKLKTKCNRCYPGFTDAYMNEVLIDMGFNPITKRTANKSVWYNTSGFTMFLKEKYSDDQRVVKLIDQIFDWYLK
jgi:hypothetical protein